MTINNISRIRKGYLAGGFSGFTWGLDTVLISVVLMLAPFDINVITVLGAAFLCSLLHDCFGSVYMFFALGLKRRIREFVRLLTTRDALCCMLGALLGGPLGMTFYILAIRTGGPAVTATVTAIYPLISSVLAVVLLKEKIMPRSWMGLLLCALGIFYLGNAPQGADANNLILGIIFGLITAFGWASEGVLCGLGMKNGRIDPQIAMVIREMTSGLAYLILAPVMLGSLANFGHGLQAVFENWQAWTLMALTAFVGMYSYYLWYTGIKYIGAARGVCLNSTYCFWATLFCFIFFGSEISVFTMIGALLVIAGVALATSFKDPSELPIKEIAEPEAETETVNMDEPDAE